MGMFRTEQNRDHVTPSRNLVGNLKKDTQHFELPKNAHSSHSVNSYYAFGKYFRGQKATHKILYLDEGFKTMSAILWTQYFLKPHSCFLRRNWGKGKKTRNEQGEATGWLNSCFLKFSFVKLVSRVTHKSSVLSPNHLCTLGNLAPSYS